MLALDMLAKRYGQRPSEIAGVSALGDWISYQFDIFICQRGLKAEMDLLQDESKPALTSTGFAAPPSAVKAVKIKPDGTWDSE